MSGSLDLSKLIDDPALLMPKEGEQATSEEDINMDSSVLKTAASVVTVDVGSLMACDPRPIDAAMFKKNPDAYIKELCTMSTQLLVNQLFSLPVERVDDVIVAKLPKPTTIFPREKPLPKPKPPTKWEQYAKMKGIQKTKRSRMVYDETSKEWRPTWGYNKTKDKDNTHDWLIEIGKNQDPYEDHFAKRTAAKNERGAKNELQRLRNIARASGKKKVPGIGITPTVTDVQDMSADKLEIKKALKMAKTADASMSKFSRKLDNEDKVTRGLGKKRKFESNYANVGTEKERQLKLFDKLTSNKDKSNKQKLQHLDKAANKHIQAENDEASKSKKKSVRRSDHGKHRRVSVKGGGAKKRFKK